MIRGVSGLALCFQLIAGHAAGQQSMRFEHRPTLDSEIRILFQSVADVAASGGAGVEIADLGSFTVVPIADQSGAPVWHLSYDSVRVRTRDTTGTWHEFAVPDARAAWAQIHVDSRLRVTALTRHSSAVGVTDPVGVLTGAPGLLLPEKSLMRGEAWREEIRSTLAGGLSAGGEGPDIPPLTVRAQLVLDSVVRRDRDSLAYLTLSGDVQPTSIVHVIGDDPGRFNVSGDIAGTLVWSSGWSFFVSGATRVRVVMERAGTGESGTITVVKTTRYQVQP